MGEAVEGEDDIILQWGALRARDYQEEAIRFTLEHKRVLLQMPPGAGKSLCGKLVAMNLECGPKDALVVTHSTVLAKQWEKYGIRARTVQSLVSGKFPIKSRLVILDECHHYETPSVTPGAWIQIHDLIRSKYVIGLSATPGESVLRFERRFIVPWKRVVDDGHLSRWEVHRHSFKMNQEEIEKYQSFKPQIIKLLNMLENPAYESDWAVIEKKLKMLLTKRRAVAHESEDRPNRAVPLIEELKGEKTLVLCARQETADLLAECFETQAYHSENPNPRILESFKRSDEQLPPASKVARMRKAELQSIVQSLGYPDWEDKTVRQLRHRIEEHRKLPRSDILFAVNMVKEGFDVPEIDTVIIISGASSETSVVQSFGRGIRPMEDKVCKIHVLCAEGTSDGRMLENWEKVTEGASQNDDVFRHMWRRAEKWDLIDGELWMGFGMKLKTPCGYEEKIIEVMGKRNCRVRVYDGMILIKPRDMQPICLNYLSPIDTTPEKVDVYAR